LIEYTRPGKPADNAYIERFNGKPQEGKMIGKPYSGKPNVRFDEGELGIEPFGYYASSLLY
jgi:transposase InsO family protein